MPTLPDTEPPPPDPMIPSEPVVVNITETNGTAPAPESVRLPTFAEASLRDDASTRPDPSRDITPRPSWTTTTPNSSEESETEAEEIHHCPSAFLASRLRKIAPSIRLGNQRSSIELPTSKGSRNYILNVTPKEKEKGIDPANEKAKISLGRKQSKTNDSKDIKFVENFNQALLIEESDEIDDDELKLFPVPLCEKRTHRMSLRIPTVSWKQRMTEKLHFIWQVIKKIFRFNLWNHHLKLIESRRGASVASYFLFIRWLLFMNLVILLLNLTFLVLPYATSQQIKPKYEIQNASRVHSLERDTPSVLDYTGIYEKLYIDGNITDSKFHNNEMVLMHSETSSNRMNMSKTEIISFCSAKYANMTKNYNRASFIDKIQHFLQGTGALESSLLFLGYYPRSSVALFGFIINVPVAFMLLFMVFMVICLIMMLKYSSYGIKEAFLKRKSFMNFTNDVFCAWDYCIQDVKAAELHRQSFYLQLRSSLFEVRQKKEILERSRMTRTKLLIIRIFINVVITGWIILCYWIIIKTIFFQMEAQKNLSTSGLYPMFIQFLPPVVLFIIRKPSMILFNSMVSHEKYTSQVNVNISIYRNAFLNLSSIVVLIITLKKTTFCKPKDICGAGAGDECKAPMCWETYVGQQLYKLALSQLAFEIPMALFITIPQDIIVRKYDNKYTRMCGQPVFRLHFEVLSPIYAQTLLWLGVFQSPLLPCITISYLVLLFYIQKSIVLNHSTVPSIPFKASRFNSTFVNILMISFFIIIISDVHTLINLSPSPGCGPFRNYDSMIGALRQSFKMSFFDFNLVWNFIFSAWFVIPVILLECAIIYYYWKYSAFLNSYEERLKAELYLLTKDNQFLLDRVNLKKNY